MSFEFYVNCAKGAEKILAAELSALGIRKLRPLTSGVSFNGSLSDAYHALLWLRTASRVLLVLARVDAQDSDALYEGVKAIPWEDHVRPTGSIAVDARGTNSLLQDTRFVAVRVKDAVCDRLRELTGARPGVDREHPDLRINVSLRGNRATIALDLAGEPLHRRGYRVESRAIMAPLRETLAATMLLAAGVSKDAGAGPVDTADDSAGGRPSGRPSGSRPAHPESMVVLDPLCGSGTLVIEAARIKADIAPGILRQHWGFDGWLGHDPDLWESILDEADDRAEAAAALDTGEPRIFGSDIDPAAVKVAAASAAKAGVASLIDFRVADVAQLTVPGLDVLRLPEQDAPRLLIACNPPYGERMSTESQLPALNAALGSLSRRALAQGLATDLCVITPHTDLDVVLGRVPTTVIDTFNGPLETSIRYYGGAEEASGKDRSDISVITSEAPKERLGNATASSDREVDASQTLSQAASLDELIAQYPEAGQFAARLRKMAAHRGKWARRTGVSCYRIYDADLPDYAVAIDLYQGATGREMGRRWLQIAEYAAPKTVDPALAARRLNEVMALAPAILEVPTTNVFSKVRKRDKGGSQYGTDLSGSAYAHVVSEGGLLFEVDFSSRLDTGLFLDHRLIRQMLRERAEGLDVLNLFAYTGSASVYMAAGGARSVTTVDMSQTYLAWAQRNMERNGFKGEAYRYVAADALRWVQEQRRGTQGQGPSVQGASGQRPSGQSPLNRGWQAQGQGASGQGASGQRYGLIFVDPPTFSNSTQMGRRTWDVQQDHAELLIGVSRLLTPGGVAVFSTNLRSFKPDLETLGKAHVKLTNISAQSIPQDFERNPRIHRCYLVEREGQASV